jgi:hypothetical protein
MNKAQRGILREKPANIKNKFLVKIPINSLITGMIPKT